MLLGASSWGCNGRRVYPRHAEPDASQTQQLFKSSKPSQTPTLPVASEENLLFAHYVARVRTGFRTSTILEGLFFKKLFVGGWVSSLSLSVCWSGPKQPFQRYCFKGSQCLPMCVYKRPTQPHVKPIRAHGTPDARTEARLSRNGFANLNVTLGHSWV